MRPAAGPRARTSPTWSTPAASSSTAGLRSRPSARAASLRELIERTPADGLVAGTARVNGDLFGDRSACAVLSYDYTVLAGTQGALGHRKKDRLFELIERMRLPTVFFAEGGGGRPGDTDYPVVSALDTRAFALWARPLRARAADRGGRGPLLRRQRGDRRLLGPDRRDRERLARHGRPGDDRGRRARHGRPRRRRADRDAGAATASSTSSSPTRPRRGGDQAAARLLPGRIADRRRRRTRRVCATLVPERARRAYEVRPVIETLADEGSVTFLRERFAPEMVTALARIEGRPLGVIANNPMHMAGAITSDGADKAARFLQLCDAFGLPVVSLVDTPGHDGRARGRGDRRWCATPRGCSSPAPRCACRSSR